MMSKVFVVVVVVMSALGAGASIPWVNILLTNTRACALVNGQVFGKYE